MSCFGKKEPAYFNYLVLIGLVFLQTPAPFAPNLRLQSNLTTNHDADGDGDDDDVEPSSYWQQASSPHIRNRDYVRPHSSAIDGGPLSRGDWGNIVIIHHAILTETAIFCHLFHETVRLRVS